MEKDFKNNITILNNKGIELNAIFEKNSNKSILIYLHGMFSGHDNISEHLMNKCKDYNISYICCLTRASGKITQLNRHINEQTYTITAGGTFEDFDEYFEDITCWFNYLSSKGFENFFIAAHSLACNKIIAFCNKYNIKQIKKIFLLSPQDALSFKINPNNAGMFEEAERNVKEKNGLQIISKPLFHSPISSSTYYNIIANKEINNIHYLTNANLHFNFNIPVIIIMDENDYIFSFTQLFETIC